jgi:hypothetical protein
MSVLLIHSHIHPTAFCELGSVLRAGDTSEEDRHGP